MPASTGGASTVSGSKGSTSVSTSSRWSWSSWRSILTVIRSPPPSLCRTMLVKSSSTTRLMQNAVFSSTSWPSANVSKNSKTSPRASISRRKSPLIAVTPPNPRSTPPRRPGLSRAEPLYLQMMPLKGTLPRKESMSSRSWFKTPNVRDRQDRDSIERRRRGRFLAWGVSPRKPNASNPPAPKGRQTKPLAPSSSPGRHRQITNGRLCPIHR